MIRNDCIIDLENTIENLMKIKGYTTFDIIDCISYLINNKYKLKDNELFIENKPNKNKQKKKIDEYKKFRNYWIKKYYVNNNI